MILVETGLRFCCPEKKGSETDLLRLAIWFLWSGFKV
jgi:hypothetical protein